jgi:hypothetical protein
VRAASVREAGEILRGWGRDLAGQRAELGTLKNLILRLKVMDDIR